MTVLALITDPDEIVSVLAWGSQFAAARDTTLTVWCWSETVIEQFPLLTEEQQASDILVDGVRSVLAGKGIDDRLKAIFLPETDVYVRRLEGPDPVASTIKQARIENPDLLIAVVGDDDSPAARNRAHAILRHSPCRTVVLFSGASRAQIGDRILVGITDSPHDGASLFLAARMAEKQDAYVTVARTEKSFEDEALEVGRRELAQMMRDVGMRRSSRIRRQVFRSDAYAEILAAVEKHDLFLVASGHESAVPEILHTTHHPTVGVVKRAPPLRRFRFNKRHSRWNPVLSPADYTDLIQALRRGSKLSTDFLIMLGLAAAIASLGLLQDSAAVVIGSMLLAPLMTPMLGCGLALAQANPKLGRTAMKAILSGFLLTLCLSYFIGWITPGRDITIQVLARGTPNLLDLGIAVFSAAAGAYALARPNLAGSIAGVAIATALVPPLCSVGISLAYHEIMNAVGAAVLFTTNVVAIILGAAATFRMMGVTAKRAEKRHRRWVFRTTGVLALLTLLLVIPLERSLERNIDLGKPQARMYPLTKSVADALEAFVEQQRDVALISAGRPGSLHASADVIVVLSSPHPVPYSLADQITKLIRARTHNPDLVVAVHCVREGWATSTAKTQNKPKVSQD